MNEPDISPLAKRLAEENNVRWQELRGSGAGGKVVERDVLEYLARVMAGEEAIDPTPEPLPDGMEAWPDEDLAAFRREAVGADLNDIQAELSASEVDDDGSELISEDIFLFDEPEQPVGIVAQSDDDDDEDDSLLIAGDEGFAVDDHGGDPGILEPDIGLAAEDTYDLDGFDVATDDDDDLDLDFSERDVDSGDVPALFTEEEPAGDGPELLFAEEEDPSGLLPFAEDDEAAAEASDSGDFFAGTVAELPSEGEGEPAPTLAEPSASFGDGFGPAAESGSADALELPDEDLDLFTSEIDAAESVAAEPVAAEPQVDFGDATAAVGPSDADAEATDGHDLVVDLVHSDAVKSDLAGLEDAHGVDEATVELTDADIDESGLTDAEDAHGVDEAMVEPTDADIDESGLAGLEDAVPIPLPNEVLDDLPLVSHGALLRRHIDLTALADAQLAVGRELDLSDPISPTAFLVRAAAKALLSFPLSEGELGLAAFADGLRVATLDGAAMRPFTELIEAVGAHHGHEVEVDALALVVADMSEFEVDEAVLHLGVPVLVLGRILYDNQRGSYRSTLSLSGDLAPDRGARLLGRVAELLAAPVQLVL